MARSLQDYVEIAVRLAVFPHHLHRLRKSLARRLNTISVQQRVVKDLVRAAAMATDLEQSSALDHARHVVVAS